MTDAVLTPTGRRLGWGVVGAGAVASKLVADLQLLPDARLVGVVASRLASAQRFADGFGAPFAGAGASGLSALLEEPAVDVVYVATPHDSHFAVALTALRAGKHVLCEKPFTVNAAQAERLVEEARASGVFLMEAVWTRFIPSVLALLAEVRSGRIGEPRRLAADIGFPVPFDTDSRLWKPDNAAGALLEMGSYPLTWAAAVFGQPRGLTASGTLSPNGVDAEILASLEYGGGRRADVVASFASYGPGEVTIVGSRGWVRTRGPIHSPAGFVVNVAGSAPEERTVEHVGFGYAHQLRAVTSAIHAGANESAIVPLDESIATMRTMDKLRGIVGVRYPDEVESTT
ncbi:Gfo/Idh/MocA family protein [Leifsonia sp. NPDC058194]|uniref:Gfo/Idh/MocA family protein n=1 Tax=Leifsonia sp. NPDC058194 TaxID=3346374 RepID=UPI0036DD2916